MDKHHIVKGYKGVIDLDLSLVPKSYIKFAIAQHYKDIEEYKKYQQTLKPEHRYENTIMRIDKQREYICMKEKAYLDAIDKAALDRNNQYNKYK